MKTSSIIADFFKNFCIGGTIIGLYSLVIKYVSPILAGHMSGSLPLVFSYVVLNTYFIHGYEKAQYASMVGFRGGFFWLSFAFIIFVMLKTEQNIILTFSLAISIFILFNYILYMYYKHNTNLISSTSSKSPKLSKYVKLGRFGK